MIKKDSSQIKSFLLVTFIIFAIALSSLKLFSQSNPISDCSETITIDEIEYPISKRWCGKKIDTTEMADSKSLVKLSDELTFENYRIYVTSETKQALEKMSGAAGKAGVVLIVDSGFRSVWYQRQIIRRRLEQGDKLEKIIGFVAPPGYSEHHTGRAVDFVPSEARFAHSEIYRWLKSNAAKFGFHETFPEDTTGLVPWESWHWVYVPE